MVLRSHHPDLSHGKKQKTAAVAKLTSPRLSAPTPRRTNRHGGPSPARCLRPESEVQWGQGPCSARAPPPWLPPRAGQPAAPGVRPIPSSKPAAARQAELPGPAEHEKRHDTPDIELTRNE